MTESAAASIAWRRSGERERGAAAVFRVEISKLAAQTPARLAAAICLVAPFAFAGILRAQQAVPADTLFGRWVHVSGLAVPLVILGFAGSWGFPALAGLIAGDVFSSEDRHGTWKLILTRSRSRFELFAGKILAAACVVTATVALLAVASLAAGMLLVGTKPLVGLSGQTIPAGHAVELVAASWALALAPVLGFTSLAILLSVTTRSSVVGVFGPAAIGLVMQLLGLLGSGEVVRTLLLGSGFDAWHGMFASPAFHGPVMQAVLVSGVYVLVALVVAWARFRGRDIAGDGAERRSWRVPAAWAGAAVALVALLVVASGLGRAGVSAGRLDAAIAPEFGNLVGLRERLIGRTPPAGSRLEVLSTCLRRGAPTPYRGAGDDWTCTLSLVGSNLRQLPANYDVDVRPNGCYTAEGPASVGGATLGGVPNPLHAFDGCFEP
jgi:ABC-2 type transport system permease protein